MICHIILSTPNESCLRRIERRDSGSKLAHPLVSPVALRCLGILSGYAWSHAIGALGGWSVVPVVLYYDVIVAGITNGFDLVLARKLNSSSLAKWSKDEIKKGLSRLYHIHAGPRRLVGKARHIRASDVSYRAIWARKVVTCYAGSELPLYASSTSPTRQLTWSNWARNGYEELDNKVFGLGWLVRVDGASKSHARAEVALLWMALHPVGSYLELNYQAWGNSKVHEKGLVGMLLDRGPGGVLVTVPAVG
ncbi:hypothetical protein B296_00021723 [Ensete ventricosum]|uniref:Uncharacterized protein n=1 Tax=Ensete ventricosum TaxID=4639 RepID=A0A427A8H0_ENSVE|nr:hypothetical protein B296_00021723 [Ensete ventricosum]